MQQGIRSTYDKLLSTVKSFLEEIDRMNVLNEYNSFLQVINRSYEELLALEEKAVKKPLDLPIELTSLQKFYEGQECHLNELSLEARLEEMMKNLEDIYPLLSEEEKMSAEERIHDMKKLCKFIVEILLQRLHIAEEWTKVLQIVEQSDSKDGDPVRLQNGLEKVLGLNIILRSALDEVSYNAMRQATA